MKNWTTDSLRILDPQGAHVLTVMPVPAADMVAQHIANILTLTDSTNTTTMTLGNGEDTVTCAISGEFAGELADRISALLQHSAGLETETIANLGYTMLESMQTVERLDKVNDRLLERAAQLALALEKMVRAHDGAHTATQIIDAVQNARKVLGQ